MDHRVWVRIRAAGLGVWMLASLAGCQEQPAAVAGAGSSEVRSIRKGEETATRGRILITADESLRPMIEAGADNFEAIYEDADLVIRWLPGELAVEEMLNNDSVRLAISTRMLTDAEAAVLGERQIRIRTSGIARDGIAVLLHPSNPDTTLSREALTGLLDGGIRRWAEVNPRSPLGDVRIVFDHPQSSTSKFIRDSLLAGKPLRSSQIYSQHDTEAVLRYVAQNPDAIGFIGWSWISDSDDPKMQARRQGVRIAWLERPDSAAACDYGAQFFGPYQSFLDRGCYPLTRTVTTLLRETTLGLGNGFIAYLNGPQGQRIIHKTGLAAARRIPRLVRIPPKPGAQDPRKNR
ncbi:MAG: substrate-binding domain-containing protein [Bacteroidia bacterium]|nr:substrate-binding domain-containing protein [Bacteroidia bacterium]